MKALRSVVEVVAVVSIMTVIFLSMAEAKGLNNPILAGVLGSGLLFLGQCSAYDMEKNALAEEFLLEKPESAEGSRKLGTLSVWITGAMAGASFYAPFVRSNETDEKYLLGSMTLGALANHIVWKYIVKKKWANWKEGDFTIYSSELGRAVIRIKFKLEKK